MHSSFNVSESFVRDLYVFGCFEVWTRRPLKSLQMVRSSPVSWSLGEEALQLGNFSSSATLATQLRPVDSVPLARKYFLFWGDSTKESGCMTTISKDFHSSIHKSRHSVFSMIHTTWKHRLLKKISLSCRPKWKLSQAPIVPDRNAVMVSLKMLFWLFVFWNFHG